MHKPSGKHELVQQRSQKNVDFRRQFPETRFKNEFPCTQKGVRQYEVYMDSPKMEKSLLSISNCSAPDWTFNLCECIPGPLKNTAKSRRHPVQLFHLKSKETEAPD